MSETTIVDEHVTLEVDNVGGISETTIELTPGVTVLEGRNATNRTSLLQAIMAALGSESATVKGEADEGQVKLTIGDKTYERRLSRPNGTITTSGNPYLEDTMLADLFAFLLETNEARQAVARGDDLRDIIMRPVDTDEIERSIDQYRSQRDEIDRELEDIDRLAQTLPELEGEKTELKDKLEQKRERLANIKDEIADYDVDTPDKQSQNDELEEKLGKLTDIRTELESVRRQLETRKEGLDALEEERDELKVDREKYDKVSEDRLDEIESEIQRLRNRKDDINSTISELQTVIEFNENLLDGSLSIFSDLHDDSDQVEDLTDQLLEDHDDLACWTCGNQTDTAQIESMLDKLHSIREEYMRERKSVTEQIDDLNDQRRQLEERRQRRSQIENRLENIAQEITRRENQIAELKRQRSDLAGDVEALETEVERLQTEDDQDEEILDFETEAARLEVEIERLKNDLESVTEDLDNVKERVEQREQLEGRRREIQSEIEELRNRVDTIEQNAVDEFNSHMETVLDILSYDNIERIWVERTEETVRKGRRTVTEGQFELHIVRSTESGTIYEDTVDHLSESEREVTGLVFALSGYLVHDMYEQVPFMLLDSIEAIDAQRLAELIEYFQDHAQYLVVALLEEDAQALDDGYQRIDTI